MYRRRITLMSIFAFTNRSIQRGVRNSRIVPPSKKKTHYAWDTRPWEGGRWNGDPDKPWKEGTAEPVHIGFKEEWDLNETRRRKHATHGVWTEPLVEGAKKAKWGKETFNQGRYRCCDDLENCGVPVKVILP